MLAEGQKGVISMTGEAVDMETGTVMMMTERLEIGDRVHHHLQGSTTHQYYFVAIFT